MNRKFCLPDNSELRGEMKFLLELCTPDGRHYKQIYDTHEKCIQVVSELNAKHNFPFSKTKVSKIIMTNEPNPIEVQQLLNELVYNRPINDNQETTPAITPPTIESQAALIQQEAKLTPPMLDDREGVIDLLDVASLKCAVPDAGIDYEALRCKFNKRIEKRRERQLLKEREEYIKSINATHNFHPSNTIHDNPTASYCLNQPSITANNKTPTNMEHEKTFSTSHAHQGNNPTLSGSSNEYTSNSRNENRSAWGTINTVQNAPPVQHSGFPTIQEATSAAVNNPNPSYGPYKKRFTNFHYSSNSQSYTTRRHTPASLSAKNITSKYDKARREKQFPSRPYHRNNKNNKNLPQKSLNLGSNKTTKKNINPEEGSSKTINKNIISHPVLGPAAGAEIANVPTNNRFHCLQQDNDDDRNFDPVSQNSQHRIPATINPNKHRIKSTNEEKIRKQTITTEDKKTQENKGSKDERKKTMQAQREILEKFFGEESIGGRNRAKNGETQPSGTEERASTAKENDNPTKVKTNPEVPVALNTRNAKATRKSNQFFSPLPPRKRKQRRSDSASEGDAPTKQNGSVYDETTPSPNPIPANNPILSQSSTESANNIPNCSGAETSDSETDSIIEEQAMPATHASIVNRNVQTTYRTGDTLVYFLPDAEVLWCTEDDCVYSTIQSEWSHKHARLKHHLLYKHDVKIVKTIKWCSICEDEIKMQHVMKHPCLKIHKEQKINAQTSNLPLKCLKCHKSFINHRQLKQHARNHYLKDAKELKRKLQSQNDPPQIQNPYQRTRPPTPHPRNNNEDAASHEPEEVVTVAPATPPPSQEAPPNHIDSPSRSQTIEENDETFELVEEILDNEIPENIENDEEFNNYTIDPDEETPSDPFINKFLSISHEYDPDKWPQFEELLTEFINAAKTHVKLDKVIDASRPPPTQHVNDPTFIQRLYRRNRRSAIRKIVQGDNVQCKVPHADLIEKFYNMPQFSPDTSVYKGQTKAAAPPGMSPFSVEEVRKKLRSSESTAPGPDRLTYNHWRSFDTEAKVLTIIFNICLKARMIPSEWKHSRTIFIPKSGDPSLPENWRPIALSSTIYKLFSSLIAKRMSNWFEENSILSPFQRGFRPFDGTIENNFILDAKMNRNRRKKRDIVILLIDIKNAFGSIPHAAVRAALEEAGADDPFLELIDNMNTGNTTQLLTANGLSEPIPVKIGVKQGCPKSGNEFNVAINPAFKIIQDGRSSIHGLGYADDKIIIEDNKEDLEETIVALVEFYDKIGLTLNPNKCKTIHITGDAKVVNTVFHIKGIPIPTLAEFEPTKYLGKPFGFHLFEDNMEINRFIDVGKKILESELAPWQKLDGVKSFFYPSLNYAMRTAQHSKTQWQRVDNSLMPLIKKTLGLPSRATNSYIHGNTDNGLFGIPEVGEDSDIAHIDTAYKLLSSEDKMVSCLAWASLHQAVSDRISNPSISDLQAYMCNQGFGDTTNRFTSVWAKARVASRHLGVGWQFTEDKKVSITCNSVTTTDKRKVYRNLRTAYRNWHSENLRSKSFQGKTFECFSATKASYHFHKTGDFLRFTDWNFIHMARLSLVVLNAYDRRIKENEKHKRKCRRCEFHYESLPHVLNHCDRHLAHEITDRHNRIVERIKKAAIEHSHWSLLREDQSYGSVTDKRPDLILTRGYDEALILDVTVPFEESLSVFNKARSGKIAKYSCVANEMRKKYKKVYCDAIVVGSLGSWDKRNEKVLSRICSKKYAKLLRKLIVSDTIRASHDIYWKHRRGIKPIDKRSRFAPFNSSSNKFTNFSEDQFFDDKIEIVDSLSRPDLSSQTIKEINEIIASSEPAADNDLIDFQDSDIAAPPLSCYHTPLSNSDGLISAVANTEVLVAPPTDGSTAVAADSANVDSIGCPHPMIIANNKTEAPPTNVQSIVASFINANVDFKGLPRPCTITHNYVSVDNTGVPPPSHPHNTLVVAQSSNINKTAAPTYSPNVDINGLPRPSAFTSNSLSDTNDELADIIASIPYVDISGFPRPLFENYQLESADIIGAPPPPHTSISNDKDICSISVGDGHFSAHTDILSASSSYIQSHLAPPTDPNTKSVCSVGVCGCADGAALVCLSAGVHSCTNGAAQVTAGHHSDGLPSLPDGCEPVPTASLGPSPPVVRVSATPPQGPASSDAASGVGVTETRSEDA